MTKILDKIHDPKDIRVLSLDDKKILCKEIREELITTVSKTGGHLASNLGVVELTVAIHSVFNTPEDKVVFDVGHQTYVHKMLTGRRDRLATLRKMDGLSGFPKRSESIYDTFETGHSGTSISAALGMARARDIKGDSYRVIAVIGDGAMTSGMALEALNDAGASATDLIVILNDNEMSIDPNTGGLNQILSKMRTKPFYRNSNKNIRSLTLKIPFIGKKIVSSIRRLKHGIKQLIIPNMFFEDIGFKYLGVVDANDYEKIEAMLYRSKDLKGPILVHAKTIKGKGYKPAETNPDLFHGVGPFDIKSGKPLKEPAKDYSEVFGQTLVKLAHKNPRIAAITAAMASGTGLLEFKKEFPDRFFDVEIAEQHALTLAAGMAANGIVPVISIYSSFFQRAYDQLIHDVCMQNLHVVMCLDRSGIVGSDGETHQGIFDLAFLRPVPNLKILAPKDFKELEVMLEYAVSYYDAPIIIRYPRGSEANDCFKDDHEYYLKLLLENRAETIKKGTDFTIVSIGKMAHNALEAIRLLNKEGLNGALINAMALKPLDLSTIIKESSLSKKLITIEDGVIEGGLYSELLDRLNDEGLNDYQILGLAYPDDFIKQGTIDEIEAKYQLDPKGIADKIKETFFKDMI